MLPEGDPGFGGPLEYLGQSTGELHQAARSRDKADGRTTCPDPFPCPRHPHPQELEPAAAAPRGSLRSFCFLFLPKGTQAPFSPPSLVCARVSPTAHASAHREQICSACVRTTCPSRGHVAPSSACRGPLSPLTPPGSVMGQGTASF